MIVRLLICIVAGYLVGSFSTGYIVGKFNKLDIRKYGSGNAGTTNAFRTMGKKAGIITFIGDFCKALIPLLLIKYVFWRGLPYVFLLQIVFGFSCVLGHNFPVWLHFKGGKGIAVTGGVFVALDPRILIPGILLFAGLVIFTKYVSIGSLAIATLFPIWIAVTRIGDAYYIPTVAIALLYAISAFYSHRANIIRLKNGTENKIGTHVSVG